MFCNSILYSWIKQSHWIFSGPFFQLFPIYFFFVYLIFIYNFYYIYGISYVFILEIPLKSLLKVMINVWKTNQKKKKSLSNEKKFNESKMNFEFLFLKLDMQLKCCSRNVYYVNSLESNILTNWQFINLHNFSKN